MGDVFYMFNSKYDKLRGRSAYAVVRDRMYTFGRNLTDWGRKRKKNQDSNNSRVKSNFKLNKPKGPNGPA